MNPNHIGIILDGNRRWAKERGLTSIQGHIAGAKNIKKLALQIFDEGIKVLSIFAFSTENFKRSAEEVNDLMNLFIKEFKRGCKDLVKNNIKIIFSGKKYPLREDVINAMDEIINMTKDNNRAILNICLNYGGRSELVDTMKKLALEIQKGTLKIDDITEETINNHLYHHLPDIDLLIRTSGECRISNFMLWQLSYSELFFTDTYFPDFHIEEFKSVLNSFQKEKEDSEVIMKIRLISAAIMLAIVVPCYYFGGTIWAMLLGIISLLAYKEILDLKESHIKYPPPIIMLGALSLLLIIYQSLDGYSIFFGLSYFAISLSILMLLTPSLFIKKYTTKEAFYLIGLILLLGLFFNSLILLEQINNKYFIYLLIITITTDTVAMIIGNLIGRHALTPISPKKTVEGAIVGSLVGTLVASLFYINLISNKNILLTIIITLILSIIAQVGDLLFSKIKRENNIKDFSNIIPGHGGILDRLDSIIFTVLAFVVILTII